MKTALGLLVVVALVGCGVLYYTKYVGADPPTRFRTATIKQGDLLSTISATGTVQAEENVDVGAQVVGRIQDLGIEPSELNGRKPDDIPPAERAKLKRVDYRTVVHPNTELAYIDPAIYKAQLAQAEASLERAKADVIQLKAKREQAEADWQRAQRLRPDRAAADKEAAAAKAANHGAAANNAPAPSKTPLDYRAMSDSDYDLARANHDVAEANVQVGEKTVKQAEATRDMAQTNLDYTTIKSPVEGEIVDRRVNIGQTVVSSLNAPSLFLIAKDLKRMQVWAQVNEADIGKIRKGMPVRFTLDAFQGEVFRGTVAQIRVNASITQNVVTYPVIVAFDNSDGRVYPYLTANVQFELEQRHNVLLVPTMALRWKPRPEQIAPDVRQAASPGQSSKGFGKGGGQGGGKRGGKGAPGGARSPGEAKPAAAADDRDDRGRLWVQDGNFVRPIEVMVGATDGSSTEVRGENLQEGLEVVIGELRAEEAGEAVNNPFAPKLFRGGAKKDEK